MIVKTSPMIRSFAALIINIAYVYNVTWLDRSRSSHSLCGDTDTCGPLASHPFCATHCTSKHITYQSNNSCFGALQC